MKKEVARAEIILKCVLLVNNLFDLRHKSSLIETINYVLNNDLRNLKLMFYHFYCSNQNIISQRSFEQLKIKDAIYMHELEAVENLLKVIESNGDIYLKKDSEWNFIQYSVGKKPKKICYRIYCNIKYDHLLKFISIFLNYLKKFPNVLNNFSFKFFNPRSFNPKFVYFTRREKFVFYLSNKDQIKYFLEVFTHLKDLFYPDTVSITKEIFKGLGVSFSPGTKIAKEHSKIFGLKKDVVSFGRYISGIIATNFASAIRTHHDKVIKSLNSESFGTIRHLITDTMKETLSIDPRLDPWVEEYSNLF